ncbi:diaminopimelate decarboxylase [Mycolicibacterium diernhoferi]
MQGHPPGHRQRSGHPRCQRSGADVSGQHAAGTVPAQPRTTDEIMLLAPNVWPRNLVRGDDGVVSVAGVSVTDLAEQFGTPLFVIDEDDFRGRCREIADAFGGGEHVHYASKAFLCSEIARWVHQEGLSLDVATGGELAVALHADFPAERITVHGNNKSVEELTAAVNAGVGHIVIDSEIEIERLEAVAGAAGVVQDVLVRVTPGVEAHTHEFISTAHEDQKFGLSLASGAAMEAVRRVFATDNLRLVGLHCHVGSQIFDVSGFEIAARRLLGLLADVVAEFGVEKTAQMSILDLGGGLGISYLPQDDPPPMKELADKLKAIVTNEAAAVGLPTPTLVVEPGRAIAGPGTITLYEVGTVKDVATSPTAHRRYVSVDGGMSDNIRPALYAAEYDARLVSRVSDGSAVLARIVGKHCESGDIIVRDTWVSDDLGPGDLLAVAATGAYCYSMSSRYNMLRRPAVVAVKDGTARLILRRETIEDLLSLEVGQ